VVLSRADGGTETIPIYDVTRGLQLALPLAGALAGLVLGLALRRAASEPDETPDAVRERRSR
jgi:hypothetical protein